MAVSVLATHGSDPFSPGESLDPDCSPGDANCTVSVGVLSALTAATATNTIANSTFAQVWNWAPTATGSSFTFGETTAATGGGATDQFILQASTLATSTAIPFHILNLGAGHTFLAYDSASDTTPFVIDASGNVGAGIAIPTAKLHLVGTTADSTATALLLEDSANADLLEIRNDGAFALGLSAGAGLATTNIPIGNSTLAVIEAGGTDNIAIGLSAGDVLTTGDRNVLIGTNAGGAQITVSDNTFLGYQAGLLATGGTNTLVGASAGDALTTGTGNIVIGANHDAQSATTNDQLNIGGTIYGDLANDEIGIGIGATAITDITARLHIMGAGTGTGDAFFVEDSGGTDRFLIEDDGSIYAYTLASGTGGAGYDAVCIDATTFEITVNTGGDDCVVSSARFKENIDSFGSGLSITRDLNPVTFAFKNDPNDRHFGFIAEDVLEIDDRLVFFEEDGETVRGVRYQDMTAVLASAIQELDLQIQGIDALDETDPESFFSRLLGKMQNLIVNVETLLANVVKGNRGEFEELCVGSVCVTEDQFMEVFGSGATSSSSSSSSSGGSSEATPAEETAPVEETTPIEETAPAEEISVAEDLGTPTEEPSIEETSSEEPTPAPEPKTEPKTEPETEPETEPKTEPESEPESEPIS